MHKNSRFNIVQAAGNCNPNFLVIDGQRTDSGHMVHGAKILSGAALPRADAIQLADTLQAAHDTYAGALTAAFELATPIDRREACDAAHMKYEAACDALGIEPPGLVLAIETGRPAYWNPNHFTAGQRVKHGEFTATIIRHYYEGMWEVRLPGGPSCVSGAELQA